MKNNGRLIAICAGLVVMIACNLAGAPGGKADLAATVTAQAQAIQARVGTPATGTGTADATSGAELRVSAEENCREGPGGAYELVFTASPGQRFKLVGRNVSTGSWIVADPAGGTCWISGPGVVVSGETDILPEYPVPDLPTPGPTRTPKPTKTPAPSATATTVPSATPAGPNFPGNFQSKKTCTSTTVNARPFWIEDITLTWQDNAYNEKGYYILHGNPPELLMTLDANVTQFLYQISYDKASTQYTPYDQFFVQAFNDVGVSLMPGTVLDRCG